MSQSTVDVLPIGHPARRTAALAIGPAVLNGLLFTGFALVTTHDHAVRAASPWQDDPYLGAVSFSQFLVPALTVLIVLRLLLWRPNAPLPRFRADQLLRAARVSVVLVAGTAFVDWLAIARHADHPLWNATTPWLVAALSTLTATSTGCDWAIRRAWRCLPAGPSDGDWLDDLAQLVDLALAACIARPVDLHGPIAVLRRHIVAFALGASLVGATVVTGAQAFGEGWTDPVLIGAVFLVLAGGLFAFCLICDAVVHIAVPHRPRTAISVAMVVGCLGLPVSVSLRDDIWTALGLPGVVTTSVELALVAVGGALVAAALALVFSPLVARAARRAG